MGNYLLSFRVPPPTPEEDERNDPDYYDWSIPKWTPFKRESLPPAEHDAREVVGKATNGRAATTAKDTATNKEHAAVKQSTSPVTKKDGSNSLKETLTSTWSDKKPANFQSKLPRSTELHKKQESSSSGTANKQANGAKVDVSRPHTVDTKKYGDTETAASIKSATNINAPTTERS